MNQVLVGIWGLAYRSVRGQRLLTGQCCGRQRRLPHISVPHMAAHISVPHSATHISAPHSAAHTSVPHSATHISVSLSRQVHYLSVLCQVIFLMFMIALLACYGQCSLREQREQVWRQAERQWQQHSQTQAQAQVQAQANARAREERAWQSVCKWKQRYRQLHSEYSEHSQALQQRCQYVERLARMADAHVGAAARPSLERQLASLLKQVSEGTAQPGGCASASRRCESEPWQH